MAMGDKLKGQDCSVAYELVATYIRQPHLFKLPEWTLAMALP